jgi:LacI family transcriptional regulator, repressor for deo operon, udp, cdd, tsx, nupC, and nupG
MTRRLADVAHKVGVSEATVSRVLNDKPGVSASTRQAVLTALDVLGYERPTMLRGERARLVGLVLPEFQNPIFPAFAEALAAGLAQRGFTAVLCTQTVGGVTEAEYVDLLLQQQVSGIMFVGGLYAEADAPHQHYARLAERGLPTVLVNAAVPDLGFACVSTDDAVAVEQAMGHLLALGHRQIGLLVGPPDHVPSQRKVAAALRLAERNSILLEPTRIVRALYSLEAAQVAAGRLLEDGVTGIVCASDIMALGAIRAARRANRSVPRDVSVVGFDDSFLMNSTEPPLTTVRQPIEPMSRMAIDLLLSQMSGSAIPHGEVLFEPELVVRASTAPPPRD